MNSRPIFIIMLSVTIFISCEKEDVPVTLPPPGDLEFAIAAMGNDYDDQVYFDLSTGNMLTRPYRSYDLAFECSPSGFRVYLNTGKLMFVCHTGTDDPASADTSGKAWATDNNSLHDDSTAVGDWTGKGEILVIDRGRAEHSGPDRWRFLRMISVTQSGYEFEFGYYGTIQMTSFMVPKTAGYSLAYFSFNNGGQLVDVAPPANEWDIVFTKFTHTYHDEPVSSPYRYYLVTGALLNKWNGGLNAAFIKDTTAGYIPFHQMTYDETSGYTLSDNATEIGFDWKYFDFNSGYIIYPDRYYLLKDNEGVYYKIRFIDFYDSSGNKGAATFEYQRL